MALERATAIWKFTAYHSDQQAIRVDAQGQPTGFFENITTPQGAIRTVPNKWYAIEREARKDLETLSATMVQLGIAERTVRIAEAQAALLATRVRDAAIEAGFTPDQVALLGTALRNQIDSAPLRTRSPTHGMREVTPSRDHQSPQVRPKYQSATGAQLPSTARVTGKMGPGHSNP